MTYNETLRYLYSQMPEYQRIGHAAYKPGLDNSLRLDAIFGHPHRQYKTIHVGGTNGKGSVSHLLAAILQLSGYRVGLYTSPHLVDFRERIRINGRMIPKEYVVNFVEKYRERFEPVMPSFFELTMEMAFLYFAEKKVDVAVIEVGLGGRLDSTNIIAPDLCVITNIGLDHTQYLGGTLPEIAKEKAGIIKPHTPAVIGEADDDAVRLVFTEKAAKEHAPLAFAETGLTDFSAQRSDGAWLISTSEYPLLKNGLKGLAQEKNSRTTLAALRELRKAGYRIERQAVYDGFLSAAHLTGLMGRWQTLSDSPRTVCDTAHNAHGMRYVAEQLRQEQYEKLHIVLGMVNDKDITAVLRLMPQEAIYYFTKASVERALSETELARQARASGLRGNAFASVSQALEAARKNAGKDDFIFIGGSNFTVADALTAWRKSYQTSTMRKL